MTEPRVMDLSAQHADLGKHWIPSYKVREIRQAIAISHAVECARETHPFKVFLLECLVGVRDAFGFTPK